MKRAPLIWLLGLLSLFTAHAATPFYPLERLAPGQRGYALTAGPGNAIERFSVEVLALQYDVGTGFPLVLVRASGPLIEGSGGIAAGMSGSPVYLPLNGEDALLGAVGFTFPESTGNLGLVTPIGTMRRAKPEAVAAFGPPFDLGAATPVRTPLLLAGLSERAAGALEPLFAGGQTTLLPVQTGSPRAAEDSAYRLEPGGAVSVQLVRGDITIAAVGTVTLIEGDKVWAFGHPLLGQGAVSFALAPAFVTAIVPSRNVPFKLADNGQRLLGTITQDRPYAISGVVDRVPNFLPVALTLNGEGGGVTKRFEVTSDERFYAPLLGAATLQAFDEALEAVGAGTAELAWEIHLKGGRTVRVLEQITDPEDIAAATASLAAEPLALLAENVFAPPNAERVNLSVSFEREERFAEIVEVLPERERLKPGGTVTAFVRLQPYRAEPEVETLRIPLPKTLRGPVDITVRGGLEPPEEGSEEPPILSFAELLTALEENVQSSELVVETFVDGEPTLLQRLPLPYLVQGVETFSVTVQGPGKPQRGAPPREEAPEPPGEPEPPLDEDPPLAPEPFLDGATDAR